MKPLILLFSMSVTVSSGMATECNLSKPNLPVDLGSKSVADRVAAYTAYGNALQAFENAIVRHSTAKNINKELDAISKDIGNILKWNGRAGGLVEIKLQELKTPALGVQIAPSLLSVSYIGSGSCPLDVLVEWLDNPPPTIGPAPLDGYQVSQDESFFVWATLKPYGKVSYSVVFPGVRGISVQVAMGNDATRMLLKRTQQARELEQLTSLAKRSMEAEASLDLRNAIRANLETLTKVVANRQAVEDQLQKELESQRNVQGALTWLDTVSKIIAVAELATQINAMISATAPPTVTNAVSKATTPKEMRIVLDGWEQTTSQTVTQKQGDLKLILQEYTAKRLIIITTANQKGAPAVSLQLP